MKFEDSSLNEKNGLLRERRDLGKMRRGKPTPDLPGREGGGYILFSMLHLVSIKHPGDESLTRPGSCHINQHCGHRTTQIGGSTALHRARLPGSSFFCK